MVEGASGSGKSRLCWEVGMHFVRESDAQIVFVDCGTVPFEFGDETSIEHCKQCLAEVLFKRLVPETDHRRFNYTLLEVLERIKADTESTLVMLQVDEYSKNQVLARALIRACRETFRLGPCPNSGVSAGVLVVPMLSGIPFANLRGSLVDTSPRTEAHFFSLSGITSASDLAALEVSFFKAAGIPFRENMVGIQLLTSSFGGFPRLYTWCVEVLKAREHSSVLSKLKRGGELDLDTAKVIYQGVLLRYKGAYGMQLWVDAFRSNPDRVGKKTWSDPSVNCAVEHLKRLHTLAVTGNRVAIRDRVCRNMELQVERTFEELSATGLFTLSIDGTKGVIIVPLLALDAFAERTKITGSGTVAPTVYSWATMELIALCAMRCRWNAIWYTQGECVVSASELRPGATCNPACTFPDVCINGELGPAVCLAEPFAGNMLSKLRTGSDGKEGNCSVENRTIYLMTPGQAGNDFCAVFKPLVWFNQTKSRDLINKSGELSKTAITQGGLHGGTDSLLEKQARAAKAFEFDKPPGNASAFEPTLVFDIFTNRLKGAQLADSELPHNVLLTTHDNFATVVGPVFKSTLRLFEQ